VDAALARLIKNAERLETEPGLDQLEPDTLKDIRSARMRGPRTLDLDLDEERLYDKMLGALLGRGAGCILGIPVEGMSRARIEVWARKIGQNYPLDGYWKETPAHGHHYVEPIEHFLRGKITHIGSDDDLAYTILGLLILEECGLEFTTADVGRMWLKYLPMACTAEKVALDNLRAGVKPPRTAIKDNPYAEWIGADIRSDPWGYAAAGMPELAAELAYRDATLSHIKTGVYGAMFFSAAIAAAFVVDDPMECIRIGLTEIPKRSRLAQTIRQTVTWCRKDRNWAETHDRITRKFKGMNGVHTLNNAAVTVLGLYHGSGDFGKTICYTVMGGMDTDCTGATAGSLLGAMLGAKKLPARWVKPLGDTMTTYLKGKKRFRTSGFARRFTKAALDVQRTFR